MAVMLGIAAAAGAVSGQTWQESVDFAKLKSRLGAALPIGAGGVVSQVEAANQSGLYFIDQSIAEFTAGLDPSGLAVNLVDGSGGGGNGNTAHATNTVGSNFFGNTMSMAPGANSVVVYEVGNWWSNIIRYQGSQEPQAQPYRVQNHSWVGTTNHTGNDQSILRRFDYLIDSGDMTAVVGANNHQVASPQHPNLMVHSYNAIVAGRSDGRHSRGQTNAVYGPGRYRPDLVAPATVTSAATARISSAAALLHQSGAGTDAVRSETMKAVLLAGATKQEYAAFSDPVTGTANPWDRTPTRPLDDALGAGELNVYNSYLIQLGGQHQGAAAPPVEPAAAFGWDYQDHKNDGAIGDVYYDFHVAPGSTAHELSIVLAWNAKVADASGLPNIFSPQESLQNLDLALYDSTNSFLGSLIDQSISAVDNVEHIYVTNLGPGTYTLKVSGAAGWDYGLAWRINTLFDQPSADFNEDGVVDGGDFLAWQRGFGRLVGAARADGDADGDGDVDVDDLAVYQTGVAAQQATAAAGAEFARAINAGGAPGGSFANGVPEPATAGLAAGGMLLWAAYAIRRRLRDRAAA
ncbi:MAG: hypothetical protein DCC67_03825 [Planctomycetota bacterium]|nr:MAG: hypothetical protein DCC67_03825 [Planctomycetota bacterium]